METESNKRKIAQNRNWFKCTITGIHNSVNEKYLTVEEQYWWGTILTASIELLNLFDEGSRLFGLKVPENKCWCGKEGKYEPENGYYSGLVCKKHISIYGK